MKALTLFKSYFNKKSIYWAANYPKAWSLGWLTQLMIAAILYSLSFIVAMLVPMSTTDTPDVMTWYGLGFIPATFWGIFIVYRLVKYNSEKLFGNRNWLHNFIELPTYILQFAMPIFIPIILGTVLTLRIGNLISDNQFHESKVAYEKAQPFFTFNYGSGYFKNRFSNSNNYYHYEVNFMSYRSGMFQYFESDSVFYKYVTDTATIVYYEKEDYYYNYKKVQQDSLNRHRNLMKDSISNHKGIFVNSRPKLYPTYFFKFEYFSEDEIDKPFTKEFVRIQNPDSAKQIYFYEHYKDQQFVKNSYDKLLKYMTMFDEDINGGVSSKELLNLFNNNIYYSQDKEFLKRISYLDGITYNYKEQLLYIQQCKDRDFVFMNDYWYYIIVFYIMVTLSMVFSLFKNMSWAEFLLGLFIIFLIPLLSGIFMAIGRWSEESIYFTFWLEFFILLTWNFIQKRKNIRNKRVAFLLMIPHLFMPFFPIAILSTLSEIYDFWHWSYFDQYLIPKPTGYNPNNMDYNDYYYDLKSNMPSYMMLLGYIAYLFVLYPLWIKVDWIKFIAKPKKA